jgi:hypothetical protein
MVVFWHGGAMDHNPINKEEQASLLLVDGVLFELPGQQETVSGWLFPAPQEPHDAACDQQDNKGYPENGCGPGFEFCAACHRILQDKKFQDGPKPPQQPFPPGSFF